MVAHEAKSAMVHHVYGWVSVIARGGVGRMGELRDDELGTWFDADVCGSLFPEPIPRVSKLTNLSLLSPSLGYSTTLQMTRTRTYMSKPWTTLHPPLVERLSLLQRFSTSRWHRKIGSFGMRGSWRPLL